MSCHTCYSLHFCHQPSAHGTMPRPGWRIQDPSRDYLTHGNGICTLIQLAGMQLLRCRLTEHSTRAVLCTCADIYKLNNSHLSMGKGPHDAGGPEETLNSIHCVAAIRALHVSCGHHAFMSFVSL